MLRTKVAVWSLIVGFACCSGCGGAGAGLVPVEGTVTLDGKPLPGVQVTFDQPDRPPKENKAYIGRTDAAGRYVLASIIEGSSGAAPGEYRVSLTTAVSDPNAPAPTKPAGPFFPEAPPPPPERIPPAYRGGKLTFTVPEDGTDKANFELKSK